MDEQAGRAEPDDAPRAPRETPPTASTRTIWIDLLVYPTHSIPTAIAPVIIGCGLAIRDGVFSPWPALVGFLGSWAIHVAGVFTDNHELLRRHPAVIEHPELNHALAEGTLRLSTLRVAILGCLALASAAAPYLHHIGGGPVLALGLLGIAVSLSYAGGPWAYVRRGHADPIFFVMFGVVAEAATYYIQVAAVRGAPAPWRTLLELPPAVFLAGLSCGALVTSVMLIDDIRDAGFDAEKGWRTGSVRFGTAFTRAEITALVAFAYAWPLVAWLALGLDAWVLLPLVSAPLAWSTVRTIRTEQVRERLHPLTPAMARLAVVHSVLLSVGIALSR